MRPITALRTVWLPLLAAVAGQAHADAVFQFAPLTVTAPDSRSFANSTVGSPGLLSPGTVVTSGPTTLYNFLDTWQFTLAPTADLVSFVGSINFTNLQNVVTFGIDNLQLRLTGPNGTIVGWSQTVNFSGFQQMFSVVSQQPFAAGNYSLQVRGLIVGPQASYAGTLQAIAAVPVPPALPLLATGAAALAWLGRRRARA